MAMYKSLFDLSPEQTASTAMPRTVVFSNGTGSGSSRTGIACTVAAYDETTIIEDLYLKKVV